MNVSNAQYSIRLLIASPCFINLKCNCTALTIKEQYYKVYILKCRRSVHLTSGRSNSVEAKSLTDVGREAA